MILLKLLGIKKNYFSPIILWDFIDKNSIRAILYTNYGDLIFITKVSAIWKRCLSLRLKNWYTLEPFHN